MRSDGRAIANFDVIDDACLSCDGHMLAHFGASSDTRLRSHDGMFADTYIVCYLHQIIDLGAMVDYGLAQSRAIHSRIRTNFHVIFHYDNPDLRNFDPTLALAGITETVATYHHTRMQYDTAADTASMSDYDVWMKYAIRTDAAIVADKYAGIKRRIAANFGARAHIDMRENRNSLLEDRRSVDVGLRTASLL